MDHELTSWIVTYDQSGLCAMIQGFIQTGDSKELSGKQFVSIHDIGCLDLRSNTMETNSGLRFKLVGPGAQSILTNHIKPFDFIHIQDEDDGEEDYEEDSQEEVN